MSAEETTATPEAEAAKPPAPEPPARVLPTAEDIAAFIAGEDMPQIGHLFDQRPIKLFDVLWLQLKKEELLPQHWQILPNVEVDPADFDSLSEVGRLRTLYRDQQLSRTRLEQLKTVWIHLRGQQPSLWTVADVFHALRRILEKGDVVDYHHLLAGVRDVWRTMTLPAGRQRLDELWAVLEFVRTKSKK